MLGAEARLHSRRRLRQRIGVSAERDRQLEILPDIAQLGTIHRTLRLAASTCSAANQSCACALSSVARARVSVAMP